MDKSGATTVLLKVVEKGSLSAAAKQLDVPLATISRRIAELEAHRNTRLLNRSSRRINLTEPGRLYVEACKRILVLVEQNARRWGFTGRPTVAWSLRHRSRSAACIRYQ
jgi:DNA-binding transcriptional LysR family regulator